MSFFTFGAVYGVLAGIVIATYLTMRKIMESNDHGNNTGGFWDYSGKLNVVHEVGDLNKEHEYVDAMRIFRENLEEHRAIDNARKKR